MIYETERGWQAPGKNEPCHCVALRVVPGTEDLFPQGDHFSSVTGCELKTVTATSAVPGPEHTACCVVGAFRMAFETRASHLPFFRFPSSCHKQRSLGFFEWPPGTRHAQSPTTSFRRIRTFAPPLSAIPVSSAGNPNPDSSSAHPRPSEPAGK